MKKLLAIVSALVVAAACAAPPPATPTPTVATAPTPAPLTEADAIAKEKGIWDTIKNKDYDAFAAMLAPGMIEVLPEGVIDKEAAIAAIKSFEPSEVNFSDWKYLSIDSDAFVLSYTVAVKGKLEGKDFPFPTARASSAWVNQGGKWLAIYHQECELKPPMTQSATKVEPAKTATSPSATPAAAPVTGPDPIANEKIVWDLFKAKNYEAFAELVAPNQIEVEPDGVHDRAGSLKGVAMFDASKAVLSDFKVVNIDSDAALVTYTVKIPGIPNAPDGERNTSIWGKRAGKWMALFHHGGTLVKTPAPTTKASPSPATSPAPKASPSPKASLSPAAKTP